MITFKVYSMAYAELMRIQSNLTFVRQGSESKTSNFKIGFLLKFSEILLLQANFFYLANSNGTK